MLLSWTYSEKNYRYQTIMYVHTVRAKTNHFFIVALAHSNFRHAQRTHAFLGPYIPM
jgi:hypothetical protein